MQSYPSVYTLGHAAIVHLLDDPVLVEEKIDGSQINFGLFEGVLKIRSKGAEIYMPHTGMFAWGVEVIQGLALHPEWTYRGEYLQKPTHNVVAYDRVPRNHIILFDVSTGLESYLPYPEKAREAARLGLEVVPRLYEGMVTDAGMFRALLETTSILGGQKVEGVVLKNYLRFGEDKHVLMGKYVSEAFKEIHAALWKGRKSTESVIDELIRSLKTPSRWAKAVHHLRDAGILEDSPRDIGLLFKEVPQDIRKECEELIKDRLFAWAWPQISRGTTAGLAEWYKTQLLEKQFTP